MDITVLGSASGLPTVTRSSPGIHLQCGNRSILLDCGEGSTRALMRAGIPVSGLDTIFISHTHADHIGGLLQLAQTWYIGNWEGYTPVGYPPRIVCPEEAVQGLTNLMELGYMVPETIKPLDIGFVPVTPGEGVFPAYGVDGLSVRALLNSHLSGFRKKAPGLAEKYPGRRGQSLSYLLSIKGDQDKGKECYTVAYSGDVGKPEEVSPLLEEPVDLLIIELAHHSVETLAGFLGSVSNRVANVLVSHIGPRYDEDEKGITDALAHAGIPGIWVASDGLRFGIR